MTVGQGSDPSSLIEQFGIERKIKYKDESYLVRDNGAIFRQSKPRKPLRPLDNTWTFGRKNPSVGYMHIAGVPVHRIVCSAFYKATDPDSLVVDHIDTNRSNNRIENLRWVTRLENILLNPISARRIELAYGSIEEFFSNPKKIKASSKFQDISWMRTVSLEEAQKAKLKLTEWSNSGQVPSGGALGEWLYGTVEKGDNEPEVSEFESLSKLAIQVNWRVPSEFPCCPSGNFENNAEAIEKYAENISFGGVFAKNIHFTSLITTKYISLNDQSLVVVTNLPDNPVKSWGVAHVTFYNGYFYHKSIGTYFELLGALKAAREILEENVDHPLFQDLIDDFT